MARSVNCLGQKKNCTGPFNWGEAHCAGEIVKRRAGPFQRKSLTNQTRTTTQQRGAARHGNQEPPGQAPRCTGRKNKTNHKKPETSFFCCERLSASMARSLHLSFICIPRSTRALDQGGVEPRQAVSPRPGGQGRYRFATASATKNQRLQRQILVRLNAQRSALNDALIH